MLSEKPSSLCPILFSGFSSTSHATRQRPQGKNGHENNTFLQKGKVQQVAALQNIDLQERKELENKLRAAPLLVYALRERTDFGP